jgi:YHS domain-containing protein
MARSVEARTMIATLAQLSLTVLAAVPLPHVPPQDSGTSTPAPRAAPPDPLGAQSNLDRATLAIGGWDPVAYFPEGGGAPAKGKKEHSARYRGATYRFASAEHRELFLTRPSDFAPAYGGWCAYAMSKGDRVEVDPRSFLIEDGSLLLFFDGLFADTRQSWQQEGPDRLRGAADEAWRGSVQENRRPELSARAQRDGLALDGHDPTAYRAAQPAERVVRGEARFATSERGVTYHFASAANRLAFLEHPAYFEPACGGFDPLLLAQSQPGEPRLVAGEARHFAFTGDGRLVVFAAPQAEQEAPELRWARDREQLEPLALAAWDAHLAALRERLVRPGG